MRYAGGACATGHCPTGFCAVRLCATGFYATGFYATGFCAVGLCVGRRGGRPHQAAAVAEAAMRYQNGQPTGLLVTVPTTSTPSSQTPRA